MLQTRRTLIKNAATIVVAALLPSTVVAKIISATAPRSTFTSSSTAENVTEGLDLRGKTYAITGANSGLGYETMRVLTMRGAHVLAIARTQEKAEKACATIAGKTTPFFLDLADFDSVVSCAEKIQAMNIPLDGLICNAGIMSLPELQQVNGIEKQFVVNHLGHFILCNRLYTTVTAADQGRFVILSSGAYKSAPDEGIQFDNLSGERDYSPWQAYGHSKLANALFSRELAKRLSNSTATSNSVHPGVINTNLGRNLPAWQRWGSKLVGWTFMKSIPEGAATQTYVATHPSLNKVRGYYFANCNPSNEGGYMEDDAMAAKLWQVSEELTKPYLL